MVNPPGLPHGPAPGLAEASIGRRSTDELAVMCDTFRPLKLTPLCQTLDDGRYALSWSTSDDRTDQPQGVTAGV